MNPDGLNCKKCGEFSECEIVGRRKSVFWAKIIAKCKICGAINVLISDLDQQPDGELWYIELWNDDEIAVRQEWIRDVPFDYEDFWF